MTSTDVPGRLVGKRFPVDVFRRLMVDGVPLSSCVLGWDVDQWPGPVQAYTGHHTGWHDVRLVPDLDTLRRAAWLGGTAICIADFMEMGREELVQVAPRTILRWQVQRLEADGLTPQVASELEFSLYRGTYDEGRADGYETLVPTTLARADYTVQAGDQHEAFFAEARRALVESNLGPWTSQVEWGLGQWEINLEYRQALEMADRYILFKLASAIWPRRAGWRRRSWPSRSRTRPAPRATCICRWVDADGGHPFGDGSAGDTLAAPLRAAVAACSPGHPSSCSGRRRWSTPSAASRVGSSQATA